jgi:hypothetical protein
MLEIILNYVYECLGEKSQGVPYLLKPERDLFNFAYELRWCSEFKGAHVIYLTPMIIPSLCNIYHYNNCTKIQYHTKYCYCKYVL